MSTLTRMLLVLPIVAASCPAFSNSENAENNFYANRVITLQIGAAPGSGYDVVGRLVARHLGSHIPGNPQFIVENIPGSGSLTMANDFYHRAARDGTVIGLVNNGIPTTPFLAPDVVRFDPREFNFLGSTDTEQQVFVVWHDAPIQSYEEIYTTEVIAGAGGPGSTNLDIPYLTNVLLDTQIRLIRGYAGAPEVKLAMENGEVHAVGAMNWSNVKTMFADALRTGEAIVIAQYGSQPHPDLEDVPLVPMGRTQEDRMIFELMLARQEYGRPFITPPGLPEDRVALLRSAFDALMEDDDFLGEAASLHVDINPVHWTALEELTDRIYATPPDVLEYLGELLQDAYRQ